MKFKVNQSDLSANLSLVSRAVPSRLSHPILANVLVRATGDRVSLTAFDLSLGIHTSFSAEVLEEGSVTLPAKLLGDIISRLPDGEIQLTIKIEDEAAIATIKSKSGKYTLRGMGAEEFPELPEVEAEAIALPTEELLGAIALTLFSASSDESKQALTGVHLTLGHDILECAATDGHRLSVAVQSVGSSNDEGQAIAPDNTEATIPSKALQELQKVGADTKVIELVMDERVARFTCGDRVLTTRILEGQYPNYRQLIPRQFARTLVAERRAFLQSLERIAVLADQKNSVVKLSLDTEKQELAIAVDAQDVGSGREVVPCQISGDSFDIAFNVKYLLDGLKAANTAEVQMEFNTPTSPAVLSPLGGRKMTYLLMPVQIRD